MDLSPFKSREYLSNIKCKDKHFSLAHKLLFVSNIVCPAEKAAHKNVCLEMIVNLSRTKQEA